MALASCRAYRRIRVAMSYPPQSTVLTGTHVTSSAPRLLDEVRRHMRVKHYSLRTEATYVAWIKRFIFANGKRHPREMGALEVERFQKRGQVHLFAIVRPVACSYARSRRESCAFCSTSRLVRPQGFRPRWYLKSIHGLRGFECRKVCQSIGR